MQEILKSFMEQGSWYLYACGTQFIGKKLYIARVWQSKNLTLVDPSTCGYRLYVLNVTITDHLYDKEAKNQLEALRQHREEKKRHELNVLVLIVWSYLSLYDCSCNKIKLQETLFVTRTNLTDYCQFHGAGWNLRGKREWKNNMRKRFSVKITWTSDASCGSCS